MRRTQLALLALLLAACSWPAWAGPIENAGPEPSLPDAPQPQFLHPAKAPAPGPGPVWRAGAALAGAAAARAVAASGSGSGAADASLESGFQLPPCPPLLPVVNWYARFTNGPQVKPLTPGEKAWLAVRNLADPFNLVTILASSAISVGSDPDSPDGPGMNGFGRSVGVSFTQDLTGEFFATFLIPSIVHQDPHYHRLPSATLQRRIAHAFYQVVWTQGDNGKGMVNYAYIVGAAASDEVSNLYVPGRKTNLPASAARWSTGLATAPIDNFVSEFLPDVARHIHVQIVVIQRIINQVARTDGPSTP
jgi:hypothetical protein